MSESLTYFPLSYAQERLWFLNQMTPNDASYNIFSAVRISGPLDIARLQKSLDLLAERHETLRTHFAIVDGKPMQAIAPSGIIPLGIERIETDWDGASTLLALEEAQTPFVLTDGPLVRAKLLVHNGQEAILLLNMHHSMGDGWSLNVLTKEMGAIYEAFANETTPNLPPLDLQYADYADWQRDPAFDDEIQSQIAFWQGELNDVPVLQLPTDFARPAVRSGRGAIEKFVIEADLVERLRVIGRNTNTTPFMVMMGAFQTLLSRYTNQTDFAIGMPIANRNQVELENVLGYFANTLVLRADLADQPTFCQLLEQVRTRLIAASDRQDVPFEKLVDSLNVERSLSHTPIFQVAFNYQEAAVNHWPSNEITLEPLSIHNATAKFDLVLDIEVRGSAMHALFEYSTDLFTTVTMARLAANFKQLLHSIATDPQQSIGHLNLLTDEDRHALLVEWNQTSQNPAPSTTIHHWFAEQAARTPDRVAVTFGAEVLTYAELDRRSNQLAHFLRQDGVTPDSRVGLFLERSAEMVVAVLGILKAGGGYVPLEPMYPPERLAYILGDCQPQLVLTQTDMAAALPQSAHTVFIDHLDLGAFSADSLPQTTTPDSLAYIIYTSGSTGRPKGVAIPHGNVVRLMTETEQWYNFGDTDVWTLFHSIAFDFSVWEIWGALLYGGRLVVVPQAVTRAPDAFYLLLHDQQVTVLNQTPSAFYQLMRVEESGLVDPLPLALRTVIFGGEALDVNALKPWFDRHGQTPQLVNMYGITETTVHVTYRPISPEEVNQTAGSPIGTAIPDLTMYLLDEHLNPVPIGAIGEIYVGGRGLARAYFGRARLSADRFVANPFSAERDQRLYKTGDLARYNNDGAMIYIGRSDNQIQLRGFRIELGDIEAALSGHPAVSAQCLLVREDQPGEKRIVAYIIPAADAPTVSELRDYMQQRLPAYMVPSTFVLLDEFPLTPNGKINRKALPAPSGERPNLANAFAAPQTETEQILATVWADVLQLDRVGIHDNFFAIGGDSLLSLQIITKAQAKGLRLNLQQLFQQQTIAKLAQSIESDDTIKPITQTAQFALISSEDRQKFPSGTIDAYPLAALQTGMLYHMALAGESNIYHNTDSFHLRTSLPMRIDLFREAVALVVERHPILRTGFDLVSYSQPLQTVYPNAELPVEFEDIQHLNTAAQAEIIHELVESEKQHRFDLSQPALLRFFIHKRSANSFQFTLTECHAIFDGWSLHSTLVEIFTVYSAMLNGQPLPDLTPLTVTYADFIAQEQAALGDPTFEQFWLEHLDDCTILSLPRWQRTVPPQTFEIDAVSAYFSAETLTQLRQLSQQQNIPLKTILLTVHLKVMSVVSGNTDILTGISSNGRTEVQDGDQVRGLFINTLPFRYGLTGGSWVEMMRSVFAIEQDVLAYRRYPSAALQQKWGQKPLYEVMFNYLHFHVMDGLSQVVPDFEELSVMRSEGTNATLTVHFQVDMVGAGGLTLDLDYDGSQLSEAQVQQMAGYYGRVIEAMLDNPQGQHQHFSPLSALEMRQLLVDWNQTSRPLPEAQTLHDLILSQAKRTPDAIAVESASTLWTFAELVERSRQIAALLQRNGVKKETFVAICFERQPELIAAILGTLMAGGVFVPLDPALPDARMQFILQDTHAPIVLTHPHLMERFAESSAKTIELANEIVTPAQPAQPISLTRDNLAYAIYTSGSTGQPKGTMLTHGGATNFFSWQAETVVRNQGDGVPAYSSIGFDATLQGIFSPLLAGQKIVFLHEADGLGAMADTLQNGQQFSLIGTTPAHLELWSHLLPPKPIAGSSTNIISGGEMLTEAHIAYWRTHAPDTQFINVYGPTETVVASTAYWVPRDEPIEHGIPIGRPISNTKIYVLDAFGQPAPIGTPGELYIGGAGVARGYLNRQKKTATSFIPNPFGKGKGERLYKTGDLVRYLPDGILEFLGRLDQQVKIRGHRIELGEIETALTTLATVDEAVVTVHRSEQGDEQLVAYVVMGDGVLVSAETLLNDLRQKLPAYMLPSQIMSLDVLPLTANGKIDRRALPTPQLERSQLSSQYAPPVNDIQSTIATIWQAGLEIDTVGIHDNFFELGGHSLLLVRLHSQLEAVLEREIDLMSLLQFPTVKSLADHLTNNQNKTISVRQRPQRQRAEVTRTQAATRRQRRREKR